MVTLATTRHLFALVSMLTLLPTCEPRDISLGSLPERNPQISEWIALLPGVGDQAAAAIALVEPQTLLVVGENVDGMPSGLVLAALNRQSGLQQALSLVPPRKQGWTDSPAILVPTEGPAVWLLGTSRRGTAKAHGFAHLYPSTGFVPLMAKEVFPSPRCPFVQLDCEPDFVVELTTGVASASTLFAGGILTESSMPGNLPWLIQPVAPDGLGWGFVARVSDDTPLWARSLGDFFIRSVESLLLYQGKIIVAALGSASATSLDSNRPVALWLLQLDSEGQVLLSRSFTSSDGFSVPRLAVTSEGFVVVGGFIGSLQGGRTTLMSAGGESTFALAVRHDNFEPLWERTLGLAAEGTRNGGQAVLALGAADLALACGACISANESQPGAIVGRAPGLLRLTSNGRVTATARWEATGAVHVHAASPGAKDGDVFVAGSFAERLALPSGPSVTATADQDGFIVRAKWP